VEMLVVMAVITFLATLFIVMAPRFQEQTRARKGADQLEQWLLTAKQMALRSGVPHGVRFVADPANSLSTPPKYNYPQLLYIEQPSDYVVYAPNPVPPADPGAGLPQVRRVYVAGTNPNTVQLEGLSGVTPGQYDFTGGINTTTATNDRDWPVQVGDFIEINGGGLVHQITAVAPTALTLASPVAGTASSVTNNIIDPTYQYRIIRGPRVLVGQQPLLLPDQVIVDLTPGRGRPSYDSAGNPDLLFAPSGRLLGSYPYTADPNVYDNVLDAEKIILWVRDGSVDDPTQNEPFLVVITARTGFIAGYPLNYVSPNPPPDYSTYRAFTRDNRSGGL
jgi:hypothetical protein